MPLDQDEGLGGLRDMARALNRDEEWERKKARTREDIREIGRELVEHGRELQASVHELHPEPTAEVALTEDELQAVIDQLHVHGPETERETMTAYQKFQQALAIELGPGGRFHGDAA